jgi:hypothetical protein
VGLYKNDRNPDTSVLRIDDLLTATWYEETADDASGVFGITQSNEQMCCPPIGWIIKRLRKSVAA